MMPNMNGIEFLDALTGQAPELAERLIFLSGGASSTTLRERLSKVPNLCLEKPFDPNALRKAIRECMGTKDEANS